jgi:hypothetical protein
MWASLQRRAVNEPNDGPADAYEAFYRDFESPLMRRIRREAYG